jgi:hypothetical protein
MQAGETGRLTGGHAGRGDWKVNWRACRQGRLEVNWMASRQDRLTGIQAELLVGTVLYCRLTNACRVDWQVDWLSNSLGRLAGIQASIQTNGHTVQVYMLFFIGKLFAFSFYP